MGRASAITGNGEPPDRGGSGSAEGSGPVEELPRTPIRDPWRPPIGADLLAGVAVLAVLVAILVVFTQDVPWGPRATSAEPVPWAQAARGPASAPPDWAEVPVTRAVSDLGPGLSKAVSAKLAAGRLKIARCLAEVDGRAPAGPVAVVLRLAPRAGALHVQGIEVPTSGAAPEVVDCARRVLDGDAIPAPGVVPGRRYRLLVPIE